MQKDRSLFTGEEFIVGSSPYCFKLESPYTVEESRVKSSSSHMRSFLLSSLLLCFWTCVTEEVNKRCIQRDRKPDKNCKVTLLITLSLLLLLCTISPSPLKSVAIFLIIINPTHTEPYPGFQWVHISIWSFLIRIYIILQVIYKNTLIQVCHCVIFTWFRPCLPVKVSLVKMVPGIFLHYSSGVQLCVMAFTPNG